MDTVYLDHAATSFPKAPGVAEAMSAYLLHNGANVNRGTYHRASSAAMTVLETRLLLKELFHFPGEETHVLFTPGDTYGLNQILCGFLRPGDHVIVSSMEHNAVMRPLTALRELGVTFSRIPADRAGHTEARDLLPLIRENTRLVMVSHASNVSGTLFPLHETAELCHRAGIPLAVDAAQTAGHLDIDFEKLHLAALSVPGHKGLLGPQGIGALLLDAAFAERLRPLVTGGTGSASDSELQPEYMPDRFESGTLNLPGIFGLHAALDYLLKTGVRTLGQRERELTRLFLNELNTLPVHIAGPASCDAGARFRYHDPRRSALFPQCTPNAGNLSAGLGPFFLRFSDDRRGPLHSAPCNPHAAGLRPAYTGLNPKSREEVTWWQRRNG